MCPSTPIRHHGRLRLGPLWEPVHPAFYSALYLGYRSRRSWLLIEFPKKKIQTASPATSLPWLLASLDQWLGRSWKPAEGSRACSPSLRGPALAWRREVSPC